MVQVAVVFHKVMLLAKGKPFPPLTERLRGNIDIWWIVADGGILLLLPFLLEKHPVWHRCHTRLFAVADNQLDDPQQVKEELQAYVKDFRLNIEVHVKVADQAMEEEIRKQVSEEVAAASVGQKSHRSNETEDSAVRDDELPKRQVSTGSKTSLGSGIAKWTRQQSGDSKGRGGDGGKTKQFPAFPPSSIGRQAAAPTGLDAVSFSAGGPCDRPSAQQSHGDMGGGAKDGLFLNSSQQLSSQAPCSKEELALARGLNRMMVQESAQAELVVTNLPDMPPGESAFGYFQLVDEMTKGLDRCFLVRGTATEVITAFT
jgi:potassium/chloride transporter 4/5/6